MSGLLGLLLALMPLGAADPLTTEEIVDGTPLLAGELSTIATVEPEIDVLRWRRDLLWLKAKVWLINRQADWLANVRVDFAVFDEAKLAKPVYVSFVFQRVGPRERQGRLTGDLVVRVPPDKIQQVRFKPYARIVAASRPKQRPRP